MCVCVRTSARGDGRVRVYVCVRAGDVEDAEVGRDKGKLDELRRWPHHQVHHVGRDELGPELLADLNVSVGVRVRVRVCTCMRACGSDLYMFGGVRVQVRGCTCQCARARPHVSVRARTRACPRVCVPSSQTTRQT